MQKLKERISQLDQENQSLMVHKKNDYDGDNDTNLDVQSLIERILRYCVWVLLRPEKGKIFGFSHISEKKIPNVLPGSAELNILT